jgi:hypothetical protein
VSKRVCIQFYESTKRRHKSQAICCRFGGPGSTCKGLTKRKTSFQINTYQFVPLELIVAGHIRFQPIFVANLDIGGA